MDRETVKRYKDMIREFIEDGSVTATDEQIKFLIDMYLDEDCVVGIHNTNIPSTPILKNGLHNYNSRFEETRDLSNTVMYSGTLIALAMYPNGDGKRREDTAIILKIPNKVFSHEQGIFEMLPDGNFGIPSQFIVGAFSDGKIILNPAYQKDYNNPDAIKCEDEINVSDRKQQKKIFMREYNRNKIKTLLSRFKGRFKRKALPPAEEREETIEVKSEEINGGKSLVDLYREQLQQSIDANAMLQQSGSEIKDQGMIDKSDDYEH